MFDSIGEFFGGLSDKLFGNAALSSTPAATKITTQKPVVVVSRTATPATKTPTVAAPPSSGGFSLNTVTDFLSKVGNVAEKGINTFFTAKSNIEQLKAATKLEEVKLKALVSSAQTAPAPTQIMLPSVSDWLNNPREAASMVTPAAIAGSGAVQMGLGIAPYILGGAALLYLAVKRK